MTLPRRAALWTRRAAWLVAALPGLCGCHASASLAIDGAAPAPPPAVAVVTGAPLAPPSPPVSTNVAPAGQALGLAPSIATASPPLPIDRPVDIGVRRAPADLLVSDAPAQKCSVFRLAVGKSFCAPVEPAPSRPQYCTRSLAAVDCWETRDPFGEYRLGVADGPWRLTAEQERDRTGHAPAQDAKAGERDDILVLPGAGIIQR